VELAEADSILAAFVGVVEAIVGWSHFLIAAHGITATPYSFIDSQFQLVIPLSIRPSGLRPRLRLRSCRPTSRSRSATKSAEPTGCPAPSAERSEADAIAFRLDEIGNSADALDQRGHPNEPSSRPAGCARALDHGQSSARSTNRARTGLSATRRAAAIKCSFVERDKENRAWNR
jgi:hypothetical protein